MTSIINLTLIWPLQWPCPCTDLHNALAALLLSSSAFLSCDLVSLSATPDLLFLLLRKLKHRERNKINSTLAKIREKNKHNVSFNNLFIHWNRINFLHKFCSCYMYLTQNLSFLYFSLTTCLPLFYPKFNTQLYKLG